MDDSSLLPSARASIGRWTIDRYVEVLRWWLAGGAAGMIALAVTSVPRLPVLAAEVLFFLALGWACSRRQADRTEAMTAGAVAGALLGGVGALGRFAVQPNSLNAVNCISETLLTAAAATLLVVSALIFFKTIIHHS